MFSSYLHDNTEAGDYFFRRLLFILLVEMYEYLGRGLLSDSQLMLLIRCTSPRWANLMPLFG